MTKGQIEWILADHGVKSTEPLAERLVKEFKAEMKSTRTMNEYLVMKIFEIIEYAEDRASDYAEDSEWKTRAKTEAYDEIRLLLNEDE